MICKSKLSPMKKKHVNIAMIAIASILLNASAQAQTITGGTPITTGYISKFSATSSINNSGIFQTGNFIGVNTTSPSATFHINSICGASNIGTLVLTSDHSSLTGACGVGQTRGDLFVARNIVGSSLPTTRTDFVIKGSTGRVGIGITTPVTQLDVKPVNTNTDPFVAYDNAENVLLFVHRNGNVGLGTGSPTARFHLRNTNTSVNPLAIFNPSVTQITTINNDGAIGINTTSPGALVDAKNAPNYSWLFHGQTAAGVTRFLITDDGRASVGTTPAFTQSTLTLKSTFGSGSSTNVELVAPGNSGWQNQVRFLSSATAVRHAIIDDHTTNDLTISPGLGGGANSKVKVNGAINCGELISQTTPGTYGYGFIGKVDNALSKAIAIQVGSGSTWTENFVAYGNGELHARRIRIGDNFYAPQNGSNTNWKLAVDGDIQAKRVVVQVTDWADHVFEENYPLATLNDVETFIKNHKHLPEIPSEKEVLENGVDTGEMNKLLLKKVEELTLYVIKQQKQIDELLKK